MIKKSDIEIVDAGILTFPSGQHSTPDGKFIQHTHKRHVLDIKLKGVWVGMYYQDEGGNGLWESSMQVEATWRKFPHVLGGIKDVKVNTMRIIESNDIVWRAMRNYAYSKLTKDFWSRWLPQRAHESSL